MKKETINTEQFIKRNPDMVASKMDGETVMMSLENSEYYGLNQIGSRIWDLIAEEVQISDLIEQLTEEYEVTYEACKNDVISFLDHLYGKGLVLLYSHK